MAAVRPVISRGVVTAASYTTSTGTLGDRYLAEGSIASIFGVNLASAARVANVFPLPASLGGTFGVGSAWYRRYYGGRSERLGVRPTSRHAANCLESSRCASKLRGSNTLRLYRHGNARLYL